MMHDQADELRQLVRRRAVFGPAAGPSAPLVVVSGGITGVGTTTVAVNLAVALARQGRRAVLVDADLEQGGRLLLPEQSGRGSVVDVLLGRRNVHEVLQRGPSGIQVLAGRWKAGEIASVSATAQERLIADVEHLAPFVEVVVIDAGNGRDALVRRLWQAASSVVVVTTPDDAAVMQAYAAIKALLAGDVSVPIHTFVNQADDGSLAADVQGRITEACRRFLGVQAGFAGSAGMVGDVAGSNGQMLLAGDEMGRSFDRAAETLWAHLQLETPRAPTQRPAAAWPFASGK